MNEAINGMTVQETAQGYLRAGLCVLPATLDPKKPDLPTWKPFQKELPAEDDLAVWFARDRPMCILTGAVSGHLEMLDFDSEGELFEPWAERVRSENPELLERLLIEESQSQGLHVVYRSEQPVCGNLKLAVREIITPDDRERSHAGKSYKPRRTTNGAYAIYPTLIESRGEGGLFVCSPSPGYSLLQGDFEQLPVLTEDERELLLSAAWSLTEYIPPAQATPETGSAKGRPGDDFNARGDVRAVLLRNGWTLARSGENEYWRRPGKNSGWSATLKNGVFYVFSSNAAPFEPDKAYSPFAVYTLLEHNGDYSQAAATLLADGYGNTTSDPWDNNGAMVPAGNTSEQQDLTPHILTISEMVRLFPQLREPVIQGLLRRGETMNIISAPKVGKSWLATSLAIAIATGRPWLGTYATEPGNVLIIDNELHQETTANRIPRVLHAMGIPVEEVGERISIQNLRGHLKDIISLGAYFRSLPPGRFKLIILDAFYRFMPTGNDENDNGTMATIYNQLDNYANHLQCSFVLIHHTSKGNQSGKSLTDVGAGAGSQSRATDTHLILRRHEEEKAVVLEAAVRSWPPVEPLCLRWDFPVWHPSPDLDPTLLYVEGKKRSASRDDSSDGPVRVVWTLDTFTDAFVTEEPRMKATILVKANEQGIRDHKALKFLEAAEDDQRIYRWKLDHGKIGFATVPQPETRSVNNASHRGTGKRAVEQILRDDPQLSSAEIAQRCHVSERYVQQLRRQIEHAGQVNEAR